MTMSAKKKTHIRQGAAANWDVRRGPEGEVRMIRLLTYRDNPLAPTALVCKIGGIYRTDTHLIRVTLVDEVPNSEGIVEVIAAAHLVWKTEANWLESGTDFRWIMQEFRRGTFIADGPRRTQ